LVQVREEGRQRYYALDASGLREVHEWTGGFERFWSESFERLEAYVKELQRTEHDDADTGGGRAGGGPADRDHAGDRRAEAAGLRGVDGAPSPGAVVRAARVHRDDARLRVPAG